MRVERDLLGVGGVEVEGVPCELVRDWIWFPAPRGPSSTGLSISFS